MDLHKGVRAIDQADFIKLANQFSARRQHLFLVQVTAQEQIAVFSEPLVERGCVA